MVNLGDQLLLSWVTLKSSSQESQQVELKGPRQLELKVDNYTTSKAGPTMQQYLLHFLHFTLGVVTHSHDNDCTLQSCLPATKTWLTLLTNYTARSFQYTAI